VSTSSPCILRATIFHTPKNPFTQPDALVAIDDGALMVERGRIAACGDFAGVQQNHPDCPVRDLRGGFLLPGFIDTHVHYPQVRLIGGLGHSLLDWLEQLTLPEEARLADRSYARTVACEFVRALASHGTTTALVFGSHFHDATAELFERAASTGLRIYTGLVLSDRNLRAELHQSVEAAYRDSKALIERFHNRGRLGYTVTPRFALSASEAMFEVCRTLMVEHPGMRFQTHINESPREIEAVAGCFPDDSDYFGVYERFGLAGRRSVFAHNVHPSNSELKRLASSQSSIAHCPCSNAALGSGPFPFARHLTAGVRVSLGTDVGGGIGFGMLKEALQAHLTQRLMPDGVCLTPAQMLYLATRSGAEALDIEETTGDFAVGKSADFVHLRAPQGSVLEGVVTHAQSLQHQLSALFAMSGAESVCEVSVEGENVFKGRAAA
jgi:guanine deaminase